MRPVAHFGETVLSHELQIRIFVLKQRLVLFVLRRENSMLKTPKQKRTPKTQKTTPQRFVYNE